MFIDSGSGTIVVNDSGKLESHKFAVGTILAFDDTCSFELVQKIDSIITGIRIPIQTIKEFGLCCTFEIIGTGNPSVLARAARDFVASIIVQKSDLSSISSYFIENLLQEMISGIILENNGNTVNQNSRKSIYDQAMSFIAASANDPELNTANLARELSISVRQLQREFKKNNLTVAQTIKNQRIDLATRLLSNSKMNVLSLDEVATFSGFTSLIQMRRALSERGLRHPTRIRADALNSL
ncbi:helix-turn-helix domain-containing protein [Paeniglutamicibacter sp. Y32M11]|uniref:helix-turn-helix domain-containing protein n=1 Tax=Paeniglutamicibacter sp. Y32M11 TaxID=2853258 RepID=UPI001C52AB84|nr:helix-turn-helix domain-containing protein [Paeniglutamicibacter sp. Y32M11]QXQ09655.1 helix-turn-helix domain-containing protein [Paeniglutamicibacter sp. Y32M11]